MKPFILLATILLFTFRGELPAQNEIKAILQCVEANNKELQAELQSISSQKLQNSSENNLPDPTVSYSHLWGEKNKNETIGELIISQSFDFPTVYAGRKQVNHFRSEALEGQANAIRQKILLQARLICFDIQFLQCQQELLDERLKQAEELSAYYQLRLEKGDANQLETNRIKLELLNTRTEVRTNRVQLENKWKELTALNGNEPLNTAKINVLPLPPLPANYEKLQEEIITADPTLRSLNSDNAAALKQIAVSKQGYLPKLELGYRRNTESSIPFNGIVVGFSLPIFQNRHKVKAAKANALYTKYRKEDITQRTVTSLGQLYNEAQSLQTSIQEYRSALHAQQNQALLKQALEGGQINITEYFVEMSLFYQSKQNLLELENQYQKVMAEIHKNEL